MEGLGLTAGLIVGGLLLVFVAVPLIRDVFGLHKKRKR